MKRNHFAIRKVILILLVCLMSCSVMAQKVNLDTLTIDQLNLYKDKADILRGAGVTVALVGIVLTAVGLSYFSPSLSILGIASTSIGVPLWVVGGSRKFNAELLTLDFDELNLYKDKAFNWRKTGIVLTSIGVGIAAAGCIVAVLLNEDASYGIFYLSVGTGIVSTIVGIPLWVTGGSRKAKAELTLQKFNVVPQGSMALGLGITLRF